MPLTATSIQTLAAATVLASGVIVALVLGRAIAIPLALATLLAFVLSPIAAWLYRRWLTRGVASVIVVVFVLAFVIVAAGAFAHQILGLTADLDTYQENIVAKVRALNGAGSGDNVVSKAAKSISTIQQRVKTEIDGRQSPAAPAPQADRGQPSTKSMGSSVARYADDVLSPLAQGGLTILLTLFLLAGWPELRDKLVGLAGTDNISSTTAALDEAGRRLSSLLLAQATLNFSFGVVVSVVLWSIGVPYALLWGTTAFAMRFVPFVGSIIATFPPTLVALAVDPGWGLAIETLAVFLIGESVIGQIIEPMFLGKSAGLSPLAIVVSTAFWTVLWGPIGLVLATPLTLIAVVMGQFVPRLEFVSVLLSDAPALSPEHELYHRILAGDDVAAVAQIGDAMEDAKGVAVAEQVVLPALALAARDLRLGLLDEARIRQIKTSMQEIEKAMHAETDKATGEPTTMVFPARGPIDAIAGALIADLICHANGQGAAAITEASGLMGLASAAASKGIKHVLITTVGGMEARHLKYLAQRAAREFPDAQILIHHPSILDSTLDAMGDGVSMSTSLSEIIAKVGLDSSPAAGHEGLHHGARKKETNIPEPA